MRAADHYYNNATESFLVNIRRRLNGDGGGVATDEYKAAVNTALAALSSAGIHASEQDLEQLRTTLKAKSNGGNGVDESLLQIVASTLAYFKVASKRVIDYVPMHIAYSLLHGTAKQLELLPMQLLASPSAASGDGHDSTSGGPDLATLMVEDKVIAEMRDKLTAQRAALAKVRRRMLSG